MTRWTLGPSDGRTDGRTDPLIEITVASKKTRYDTVHDWLCFPQYLGTQLLKYAGNADATSQLLASTGAIRAFGKQNGEPWCSTKNSLPDGVWFRFDEEQFVTKINFSARSDGRNSLWPYFLYTTPTKISIIASNDCITWRELLVQDNIEFTKRGETKSFYIPPEKQGFYKCYGIRTYMTKGLGGSPRQWRLVCIANIFMFGPG